MTLNRFLRDAVSRWVPRTPLYLAHFAEAVRHYQRADGNRSVLHFQEALRARPDQWAAMHHQSITFSQLIGDIEESLRLLRASRRIREQEAMPQGKLPYRYLSSMWAAQIGHIANMEHLIKREILQGRDPRNMYLYCPESLTPANPALLEKMAKYITVVRREADLPCPHAMMLAVWEEYFLCESLDGTTKHWWHASPEIFRAWEEAGRAPILSLSAAELQRGRATLQSLGMPEGAWFACLHVREGGFKQALGYGAVESGLNAEIETYLPALRAVAERGGWIVRIGDSKMQPLPGLPRTIDYARSTVKSDWMDVFLLGACRFFIGTSSGPAYVPPLFGIPCALTNWLPAGQRPFNGRDIYIPKLYRAGDPARMLSFAEMMAPPVGYAPNYAHAAEFGIAPVPNTPEEIHEVVTEMLDRLDGRLAYSEQDEALQATFDAVAETNLCIGNARAGRDFLNRHAHLLANAAQHAA
jgi:putative glycosyltransferase (TIGR04372 family)